jgi:hypothetical protein
VLYLIHQPGKVASQTIEAAIRTSSPNARTERHHYLSARGLVYLESICQLPGIGADLLGGVANQLAAARAVSAELASRQTECSWVITGVRDPLDLCISAFFQNLPIYCPWITYDDANLDAETVHLIEFFTAEFDRMVKQQPAATFQDALIDLKLRGPAPWVDQEFNEFYGVDIYSKRMNRSTPFISLEEGSLNLIVYRTELLSTALHTLLRTVGLSPVSQIMKINTAESKIYSRLYKRFREEFRATRTMINYYYGSKFFQHFYGHLDTKRFAPNTLDTLRGVTD